MGRNGHVQTRPPEHNGSCITDWAQSSLCKYLVDAGLEIETPGDDWSNAEDADCWEIPIPEIRTKNGNARRNYRKILSIAKALRANPDAIKDDCGEGAYGDIAASILEEGVAADRKYKTGYITINWW